MKFIFVFLSLSILGNSGFALSAADKIDPNKIKNEIYDLRVKCKDLDIRSSLKIFDVYIENSFSNLGESSIADLQEAIIRGAKHNGMRITFNEEKKYGDLMFIVPFDVLEDFKAGKLGNTYESMLQQDRLEDRILKALFEKESKEKPLIIVNGKIVDSNIVTDGKKYTASSLSILSPNAAVEKYGKVAMYGAVEYTNFKFREE